MFQGVYTAIITPFSDNKIDYDNYFRILDNQIQSGISGIVPCGTTGESPTLDHDEHSELIRRTVEYVKGRVKVVAGTGSNSTAEAIELTKKACDDGVDGVLSVNPYYNKPTQEGLYRHFWEIAEQSSKPIMLYNIPGRTSVSLTVDTVLRLSRHKQIRCIKEATGDLGFMAKLTSVLPGDFTLLSGDDNLTIPVLAIGGKGVVSVVSNIFPASIVKMVNLWNEGKLEESRKIYFKLMPVFQSAFMETNPIPVKAAMSWLGYCKNELRLPMTSLTLGEQADQFKKIILSLREEGLE
ncbi:4-hydroxy-tetrahydrodipicolinate synthase [Leptospira sp. GIMC2001]|uniref:4-hydroxy-tetrahydrodipicolinate synthase n=1 Tax=Leptospira sp. GIMC2001 TaxID=1513297 RepID=UPI00234BA6AB|nr:4-hydroxy-tetrahydrodipicolinate synthase [Leptospira sp. GIMC2001]WCL48743.1 4-hydroxy-tetrahydrodipicolinate synthase [Leptospira sp. GIMC2001]